MDNVSTSLSVSVWVCVCVTCLAYDQYSPWVVEYRIKRIALYMLEIDSHSISGRDFLSFQILFFFIILMIFCLFDVEGEGQDGVVGSAGHYL